MPEIVNGIDYVMRYLDEYKIRFMSTLFLKACIAKEKKEILISQFSPLEEQVYNLIHELIHLHPIFIPFTEDERFHSKIRNKDDPAFLDQREETLKDIYNLDSITKYYWYMENQIDKITKESYDTRPDIVDKIKKALEETKKIYL